MGDFENAVLIILLITVVGAIILFFIFHAIFCWYFKLNRMVELLEKLNRNLSLPPFLFDGKPLITSNYRNPTSLENESPSGDNQKLIIED